MKTITAKEFEEAIKKDPSWGKDLTETTIIVGTVLLKESKITHLPKCLHFVGDPSLTGGVDTTEDGDITPNKNAPLIEKEQFDADFSNCHSLVEVNSTFYGCVSFRNSRLGNTKGLVIYGQGGGVDNKSPHTSGGEVINPKKLETIADLRSTQGWYDLKDITIHGYADFQGSWINSTAEIKFLRPLHLQKEEGAYRAASFRRCNNLRHITGKIEGSIDASESSVWYIRDLEVGKDEVGNSANFSGCKSLPIAQGTYNGFVSFAHSGIKKIENLEINGKNTYGHSVGFQGCNLRRAEGDYPGFVNFERCDVQTIEALYVKDPATNGKFVGKKANFLGCKNLDLKEIPKKYFPKLEELYLEEKLNRENKIENIKKKIHKGDEIEI